MPYICSEIGLPLRMASQIRHQGIIDRIEGQSVIVRIEQTSACSGCQAKGVCRASESKEKLIEVENCGHHNWIVGQTVIVSVDQRMGARAVLLSFGLPLVLMILTLVFTLSLCQSEMVAALASIGLLIPYYIVLFLLRGRLKRDFEFSII